MTQRVLNGFPQYFDFIYLRSKYFGTPVTQADQTKTDIDLVNDTLGDTITVDAQNLPLLQVLRDGAFLHPDQGYELIAPNQIRVTPGLLAGEVLEFLMFTGQSGAIQVIPTVDPQPGPDGIDHTINEAVLFTDGSGTESAAFPATLASGLTRIVTFFDLDVGRTDVYFNGTRLSATAGQYTLVNSTTIDLDDDYSAVKGRVEIVNQRVGA